MKCNFAYMEKESLRNIKQQFFVYRNGIVADKLRESGDTHKIIFGLNLPQITDIAKKQTPSASLAQSLWDNSSTRESHIIATMLYPVNEFTKDIAHKWISEVPTVEIADILCHRLLKYLDFAEDIIYKYSDSETPMMQYISLRLANNIIAINRCNDINRIKSIAEAGITSSDNTIRNLAANIIDSIG